MSGLLQIDAGYPWQDVKPGSALWRMFRGWNERRQVVGLPMLQYAGASFTTAASIDGAVIVPGANLQSAGFWRELQAAPFDAGLRDGGYSLSVGYLDGERVNDTYTQTTAQLDAAQGVSIAPMAAGDRIDGNTINAILRRLAAYNLAHLRVGPVDRTDLNYVFLPPQGTPDDRRAPLWLAIQIAETGVVGTYRMRRDYEWPEHFRGCPASYVWKSANNTEQIGTEQATTVYSYDAGRDAVANGKYDSYDIFTESASTWPPIHFILYSGTTGNPVTGLYTSATTLNMIIKPPFADLEP